MHITGVDFVGANLFAIEISIIANKFAPTKAACFVFDLKSPAAAPMMFLKVGGF